MVLKRRTSDTPFDHTSFEIAIICALPLESDAVESTFDEIYQNKQILWQKVDGDQNAYTLGRIGAHNVVLAHMPRMGKTRAAIVASGLRMIFSNIRLALVVGICGGATQTPDKQEIFLGDVIISTELEHGDFGRDYPDGIDPKDASEGGSRPAPPEIAAFLHQAQTKHSRENLYNGTRDMIDSLLLHIGATIPPMESDILYATNYLHKHHQSPLYAACATCNSRSTAMCDTAKKSTCQQLGCDTAQQARQRTRNVSAGPNIHFGIIATLDIVKKNEVSRDLYAQEHKVLAFEMEAAGVWEIFPTIVVKAVCDYSDSHKNKSWQRYAAASAAACCKTLLNQWVPSRRSIIELDNAIHPPIGKYISTRDSSAQKERNRQDYMASLDFEQLDSRYHDIRFASPKTCDWIFDSHEFLSWLDSDNSNEHNRVLYIKGKPGSGKSTMMKHVYNSRDRYFPRHIVAAYFFHGRGSELQKTRLGMLRSLLHQLFQDREELLDKFIKAFPSRNQSMRDRPWVEEELEDFLLHCARQGWLKNVVLFIDALDESGERATRGIASFVGNLSLNGIVHASHLFICLSTRQFPNVSMNHCIELSIDKKVEQVADIERYVSSTILFKNTDLISQVTQRSCHVFLWAALVVQILNQAYDEGDGLQSMLRRLQEIPDSLHEIFENIIQMNGGLSRKAILMFQLVLFAERPLSPKTLYLFVTAGLDSSQLWTWNRADMDEARLKNWITTQSRGLLEVANPKPNFRPHIRRTIHEHRRRFLRDGHPDHPPIVQVIHESVRDFLLLLGGAACSKDEVVEFSEMSCQKSIVECCFASVAPCTGIVEHDGHPYTMNDQCPHIMYALSYLPFHIGAQLSEDNLVPLVQKYRAVLREYPRDCYNWAKVLGPSELDRVLDAIITAPREIICRDRFVRSTKNLFDAILENKELCGTFSEDSYLSGAATPS